jgi:N-acetylmuramoyl-L-alanine amidase
MNVTDRPSPNHGGRLAERRGGPEGSEVTIDMLVIHYTGMESDAKALDWMCDPASQVSAHYFIDEAGAVCRLVAENRRAWHAGVSAWRGATDINSRSIGIELGNPGHEFGYREFPPAQIDALIELAQGIVARHPIPPRNVVGHADIAPARKLDPGELFPWQRLAEAGIGLWPDAVSNSDDGDGEGGDREEGDSEAGDIAAMLAEYGYEVSTNWLTEAISAFQRHFRPDHFDGVADGETRARLAALLALVAGGPAIS